MNQQTINPYADAMPGPGFDYEAAFDAADPEVLSLLGAPAAPFVAVCHVDIGDALARADTAKVVGPAHTLKCMAAYFGAQPVQHCAQQIELFSKTGDIEAARAMLASLNEEMTRFLPVLAQRLPNLEVAH